MADGVLVASFLIGAIAAGAWGMTTTAFIAALAAHQAQFPVVQMLRRKMVIGRFAFWSVVYAAIALVAASLVVRAAPALMRVIWVAVVVFALGAAATRNYMGDHKDRPYIRRHET